MAACVGGDAFSKLKAVAFLGLRAINHDGRSLIFVGAGLSGAALLVCGAAYGR